MERPLPITFSYFWVFTSAFELIGGSLSRNQFSWSQVPAAQEQGDTQSLGALKALARSSGHDQGCPKCSPRSGQIHPHAGLTPRQFCGFRKMSCNSSHESPGEMGQVWPFRPCWQHQHTVPPHHHPACPHKSHLLSMWKPKYFCSVNGSKYLKSHGAFFALISNLLNKYCCVNQQSVSCN